MTLNDIFKLNCQIINWGGKIKYVLRLHHLPKVLKLLKNNRALLNSRKHDTIYICGSGPSLAEVDLDKLGQLHADTLVVNYFVKMASKTCLQPTYYMMADAAFLSPEHKQALVKAIETYPQTKFIFNSNFAIQDPNILRYDCQKYFLAMYNGNYNKPKEINLLKVNPAFGNVICCAIAFAMGMGYKKIVLLGCDFNSFAFQHEVHCYDGGTNNMAKRRISMSTELFCYSFVAYKHLILAAYANKHKISIENSTKGSLIDAYPIIIDDNLYKK